MSSPNHPAAHSSNYYTTNAPTYRLFRWAGPGTAWRSGRRAWGRRGGEEWQQIPSCIRGAPSPLAGAEDIRAGIAANGKLNRNHSSNFKNIGLSARHYHLHWLQNAVINIIQYQERKLCCVIVYTTVSWCLSESQDSVLKRGTNLAA